ncbi:MAG TPA: Uma2 family endonuclease [Gemmatimonadaceae bacterium]|nr:Uma2 family endonuclease [Gemmatimonadaceae bacterium]
MAMPALLPRYTVDHIDELPEYPGVRYELLDGLLLVSPAPSSVHAVITSRLISVLSNGISEEHAFVAAPGEIRLEPFTSLVPDVLVYPAKYGLGAPWKDIGEWLLAVEVVSPSSAVYDRDYKRRAYSALGVGEYWVVDPMQRTIEVSLSGDAQPRVERRAVRYRAPGSARDLQIDVAQVFSGVRSLIRM